MLQTPSPHQQIMEVVTMESLVPRNHLVRQLDAALDFEFIRDEVRHLYCADNGRPAVDPVLLFKMMFIGYLFGIPSERRLVKEIQVNVAYRWFLGLNLTDSIPDASTLSQNRRRRFNGTAVFQNIFDNIVEQAMAQGLVGGKALFTDSTHLQASANKGQFDQIELAVSPSAYLAQVDAAVEEDRKKEGKKPLSPSNKPPKTKLTKVSRTDKDAGYMVRDQKPKGFFYLDHRTVDDKVGIITDSHATPGNVHDSQPYLARLDRQGKRFGLWPHAVGLDAGYFTAAVCHGLEMRGIAGVMGYRRPNKGAGLLAKRLYHYDSAGDFYQCPQGQRLTYRSTSRTGYRQYHSAPKHCATCPILSQCTKNSNHTKVITRHVWEDAKDRANEIRLSDWGKRVYSRRKETVERSFADAKQHHGHRYAKFRGLGKVQMQCLLAAACQNMKKIALLRALLRYFKQIQRGKRAIGPFLLPI